MPTKKPVKKTVAAKAAPAASAAKKTASAPAKKAAPAPAARPKVGKTAAAPAPKPTPAKAAKAEPKVAAGKTAKAPPPKAAPKAASKSASKQAKPAEAPAKPAKAAKSAPKPEAAKVAPEPVKKAEPAKKAAKTAATTKKAEPKAPAAKKAAKTAAANTEATAEAAAPKAAKAPKKKAAKAPKPPKLAPVEAAFAKPMPAKPLAVAAGRASPVLMSPANGAPATKPLPPPKTLAQPKPSAEPETVGDLKPVPTFKAKASTASPAGKTMILVGAIAGAFGVKGEVRLRAFTDKKDGVIAYGPLHGEDGKVLLRPKSWRELKDGVAVVAPEIKTKEDADKLRGQRLYVPRANLPSTAEDEFYIVDLLGCRAEAVDGKVLGEICAVWNFGAGDIIEYRPPNGGPNVRITFTKETAPLVDLPGKRVVLDPPAPEPVGN